MNILSHLKISTHTLTWSVTYFGSNLHCYVSISTHTLTWSVTLDNNSDLHSYNFNSHAHVERDCSRCRRVSYPCHFNSHAHVERDFIRICRTLTISISTHTLTWSVTMNIYQLANFICHFNSHAHVERDSCKHLQNPIHLISTHTLTWSVTGLFFIFSE